MSLLDFAGPLGNLVSTGLSMHESHKNRALQRDALKHGIQWRVEDAQRSGIHPLYALGAQLNMPSPVNADFGGVARAGEMISDRSINARHNALASQLLEAQIKESNSRSLLNATEAARLGQKSVAQPDTTPERNLVFPPSIPFRTSPTSSAQVVQDEYGDVIEAVYGIGRLLHDAAGNAARALGPYHPKDSEAGRAKEKEYQRKRRESGHGFGGRGY